MNMKCEKLMIKFIYIDPDNSNSKLDRGKESFGLVHFLVRTIIEVSSCNLIEHVNMLK